MSTRWASVLRRVRPSSCALLGLALDSVGRAAVAIAAVVLGLLTVDRLGGSPLPGILAATLVTVLSLNAGVWLAAEADAGRRRFLTAGTSWVGRRLNYVCRACMLLAVVILLLPLVEAEAVKSWLRHNGGASSVYLTASAMCVLVLMFLTAAKVILLVRPLRRRMSNGYWLARWKALDALLMLTVIVTASYAVTGSMLASPQVTYVDEFGRSIEPGRPAVELASATDEQLLSGLAPYLQMSVEDLRPPQRVDAYLAESIVKDLSGTTLRTSPTPAQLNLSCDGKPDPCMVVVNDQCPDSPACQPFQLDENGPSVGADDRVVGYGRVLRREAGNERDWESSPFGAQLQILVQYWLFVPYDDYQPPLALGMSRLVKRHAADWESVIIGLSKDEPVFVAATGHCGGSWRTWPQTVVENSAFQGRDPLGPRMHVALGYTEGSHAMYFDALKGRGPDAIGCEFKNASGLLRLAHYAANVRDVTRNDFRVLLEPVTGAEADAVLRLPAYWGVYNELSVHTPLGDIGGVDGSLSSPAGPSTPSSKPLYQQPITTVFCSATWHYDGPGGVNRADCRRY